MQSFDLAAERLNLISIVLRLPLIQNFAIVRQNEDEILSETTKTFHFKFRESFRRQSF